MNLCSVLYGKMAEWLWLAARLCVFMRTADSELRRVAQELVLDLGTRSLVFS